MPFKGKKPSVKDQCLCCYFLCIYTVGWVCFCLQKAFPLTIKFGFSFVQMCDMLLKYGAWELSGDFKISIRVLQ